MFSVILFWGTVELLGMKAWSKFDQSSLLDTYFLQY